MTAIIGTGGVIACLPGESVRQTVKHFCPHSSFPDPAAALRRPPVGWSGAECEEGEGRGREGGRGGRGGGRRMGQL